MVSELTVLYLSDKVTEVRDGFVEENRGWQLILCLEREL